MQDEINKTNKISISRTNKRCGCFYFYLLIGDGSCPYNLLDFNYIQR